MLSELQTSCSNRRLAKKMMMTMTTTILPTAKMQKATSKWLSLKSERLFVSFNNPFSHRYHILFRTAEEIGGVTWTEHEKVSAIDLIRSGKRDTEEMSSAIGSKSVTQCQHFLHWYDARTESTEDPATTSTSLSSTTTTTTTIVSDPPVKKQRRTASYWTDDEKQIFFRNIESMGRNWDALAQLIPGKTRDQIRNFFQNSCVRVSFSSLLSCGCVCVSVLSVQPCSTVVQSRPQSSDGVCFFRCTFSLCSFFSPDRLFCISLFHSFPSFDVSQKRHNNSGQASVAPPKVTIEPSGNDSPLAVPLKFRP